MPDPSLIFDEVTLTVHNIACAAAVVAAIKGVEPQTPGINAEMNEIVRKVEDAYLYAVRRTAKSGHIIYGTIRSLKPQPDPESEADRSGAGH